MVSLASKTFFVLSCLTLYISKSGQKLVFKQRPRPRNKSSPPVWILGSTPGSHSLRQAGPLNAELSAEAMITKNGRVAVIAKTFCTSNTNGSRIDVLHSRTCCLVKHFGSADAGDDLQPEIWTIEVKTPIISNKAPLKYLWAKRTATGNVFVAQAFCNRKPNLIWSTSCLLTESKRFEVSNTS